MSVTPPIDYRSRLSNSKSKSAVSANHGDRPERSQENGVATLSVLLQGGWCPSRCSRAGRSQAQSARKERSPAHRRGRKAKGEVAEPGNPTGGEVEDRLGAVVNQEQEPVLLSSVARPLDVSVTCEATAPSEC